MTQKAGHCPTCNELLDAATPVSEKGVEPKVGDISVCLYCASILEWDENMDLIPILNETIENLRTHNAKRYYEMTQMQKAIIRSSLEKDE